MENDNTQLRFSYDVEEGIVTNFRFKREGFVIDGRYTGSHQSDNVRDIYSVDLYDNGVRVFSQSPIGLAISERNKPEALLETAMALFCVGPEDEEFLRDESPDQIEWRESSRRNDLDMIRQTIVEEYNLG